MSKKSIYIILFILLGLFSLLLIAILAIGIATGNQFNFGKKQYQIVQELSYPVENISQIKTDLTSDDVRIYTTEETEIRLVEYGNKNTKKKRITSELKKGTLNIRSKHKLCIIFCFTNSSKLDIYIPKTYINQFNLSTVSGDITIEKSQHSLQFKNINLETTSGDIEILSPIKSDNVSLSTVSGDMDILGLNAKSINLDTTSGDIEIQSLTGKVDAESVSGEIDINQFDITGNSNFHSVSGDIDILLTKDSSCYVKTDTVSGSKNVSNGIFGNHKYQLKLQTVSGDIDVTQKSR